MDSEPILKKTLVTMGKMVGAWVLFVGTLSLLAVLVTSHVVGASPSGSGAASDPSTSGANTTAPGTHATPGDRSRTLPAAHVPPAQRAHESI
jgi:hypothetical protein